MYWRVYCRVASRESLTLGTVWPSGNLALGTMVTCEHSHSRSSVRKQTALLLTGMPAFPSGLMAAACHRAKAS